MMDGMMDKKMMKKKALHDLLKDGMGVSIKIKRGPAGEMLNGEDEEKDSKEKGMEMMMVSPEEKQMILEMRGESDQEEMVSEEKQMSSKMME